MEWMSESFHGGGKAYWRRRRRTYERLNGPTRHRKLAVIQLGRPCGSSKGRSFFRPVKANTKLLLSPKRFLISLRDAYVNLMVMLANGTPLISDGGYNGVVNGSFVGFGMCPVKEYDEKMILRYNTEGSLTNHDDKTIAQIYRPGLRKYQRKIYGSLEVGQGQLVPCDAARHG